MIDVEHVRQEPARPRDCWDAFIILTDIVKFSELDPWAQEVAVDHLVQGLWKLELMAGRQIPSDCYLNSTGDGFVLALPSQGRADLPELICDDVRRLVEHCRAGAPRIGPFQIRAGLHLGKLLIQPGLDSDGFAVGLGLNWAARVGGLAGPSQVLVSEAFARHVCTHRGPTAFDRQFHPQHDAKAYEASVKHGRLAEFRILRDSPGVQLNPAIPPKMLLLQQVDDHLERSLRVVAGTLDAVVTESMGLRTQQGLNARYTLWVHRDAQMLRLPVTLGDARTQDAETATCYEVHEATEDEAAHWEGPVGQAYITGTPVVLAGLPAWSGPGADREQHIERWMQAGVPRQKVEQFSRHARCILAIPMVLNPRVAGVLCIDLREPLEEISDHLDGLCRQVMAASGSFVAALLLAREQ